ncbi:hypothetical protein BC833DRAFT_645476 [Globomyces pollinis-pini]|nr:hypothetical protein BC833DRAFT_645476 [Globomyces pollinis-pini]
MEEMLLKLVNNPLLPILTPLCNYIAIKSTASPFYATLPFIIANIILPLCYRQELVTYSSFIAACFYLSITLRFLDVCQLPLNYTQKWNFISYIEYLLTFENKPIKSNKKKNHRKKKAAKVVQLTVREASTVPYHSQTFDYYVSVALKTALKGLIYSAIIVHLIINRSDWQPKNFELFTDFASLRDCYLYGLALSLGMDIFVTFLSHSYSLYFHIPYVPIMNRPYLSTSVRNYWADRWNLIVQTSLRRAVFIPVLRIFGHSPDNSKNRIPAWLLMVASLSTFVFSALMHEWLIYLVCDLPTTWEQMVFFSFHGLICLVEVVGRKSVKKLTGVDLAYSIPNFIQVIYATSVLVFFSPWFLNPFIREHTLLKYNPLYHIDLIGYSKSLL